PLLIDHVTHMGALHQSVIALTILFEESPRIVDGSRCSVEKIAAGIWRVTMRFGFIEIPDLNASLKRVKGLDPSIDLDHATYFATRDLIVARPGSSMFAHWRLAIFA
ncbi:KUP/HAK/KT family potassium transporter, partial [Klebsiella pneumoniae]|uniref:KUP/HAK/KT family potassium transporter n=1 Tax=Klebsiella pneumoniae TaxID=573 RepID=UPI001C5D2FBE